ncbi:MAG: hypothetical protein JWQ39_2348 [Glaciihabitans sp.]|jgi:TetR/AcrR family transcriptional repressor of lmrAB and yxaGH operons|nr:hypothetical protein [Glaciihabitans sp.]
MVVGAAQLLAERGLQGTSFAEVNELAGARALGFLERRVGSSALEATEYFLYLWHEVLSRSGFQTGCAVLAVTVATEGAVALSRAEQNWEPLDLVAEQLIDEVKRLATASHAE